MEKNFFVQRWVGGFLFCGILCKRKILAQGILYLSSPVRGSQIQRSFRVRAQFFLRKELFTQGRRFVVLEISN